MILKIVKVNQQVIQQHVEVLSREIPAIYPVNRVVMEYISMKANDKELIKEELFHGRVPKYLLMAMVPKAAFYGDYTKNPFNFKPFNLSSLSLKKDREIFPYEAFKPDFKNKKCLREYISLFQSNGLFGNYHLLKWQLIFIILAN